MKYTPYKSWDNAILYKFGINSKRIREQLERVVQQTKDKKKADNINKVENK